MSTAITPTPGRGGTLPLPTATTKLSQQLQAHHSLFDVDLMLQDMIALTTKMTDTLFGEDDRARKKMKISYQDHIRALTAAHSKMEASFKLLGLAFSAKNFQSGRRSETNVEIKRSYVNIPVEKRKAPEDVRQAAVLALAPPPKKSRKPAANPAPLPAESLEGKVWEFVATTPPPSQWNDLQLERTSPSPMCPSQLPHLPALCQKGCTSTQVTWKAGLWSVNSGKEMYLVQKGPHPSFYRRRWSCNGEEAPDLNSQHPRPEWKCPS
ncbi:hypothetical protein IV203_031718 [Nitzschia inconspicua]|uniref:Uncharacterized protein n=1 Tax=Nitzschia inconspicua TaxID=303405 RepID=A0A9K3LUV2_9STRA|nr:hypothetical protein IV203_031718 [Nitzschia inconspicua]